MMPDDRFENDGGLLERNKPVAMMSCALVILAMMILAAFCVGRGSAGESTVIAPPTPIPSATPRTVTAEANINGVYLFDDARVQWLTFYRDNEELLGSPLHGPQPVGARDECFAFSYYVVCHSMDAGDGGLWAYVPLPLGYDDLPEGIAPVLDAPVAPVAQMFADQLRFGGRDNLYWMGRSISPALCSNATCVQTFERAVLSWPVDATRASDVTRAELGAAFQDEE